MAANGVVLQSTFFSKDDTDAPVMGQSTEPSKFKGAFQ
jgi:phage-related minor tail protein